MGGKKGKRSSRAKQADAGSQTAKAKTAEKKSRPPVKKATLPARKNQKSAASAQAGGSSWWEKSVQFLREVRTELKKVTWPSRRQTISSTGVVLALCAIVSVFLGMVDWALAHLVRLVIG